MKRYNKRLLAGMLATIILSGLASCTADEPARQNGGEVTTLKAEMCLSGDNTMTRTVLRPDDGWTIVGFNSSSDALGLYANRGIGASGTQGAENMKLTYSRKSQSSSFIFEPADEVFNPGEFSPKGCFMYFPYNENMSGQGMELRIRTDRSGTADAGGDQLRCVDLLTCDGIDGAKLKDGVLTGVFYNIFSELIIMRGEGFDSPQVPEGSTDDPDRITVVLTNPYTHVRIKVNTSGTWNCKPELAYDPSYVPAGFEGEFDARFWPAWEGENYRIEGGEAQQAWYVIVPTLGNESKDKTAPTSYGARTQIDYIELYDNDGKLQKVTSMTLSGKSRYLDSGWRYPMTIMMQELVPTIFPYTVEPWNSDVNITNQRKRGITRANFSEWVVAYNLHLANPSDEIYSQALYQYGDYEQTDGSDNLGKWHFYLLEDISVPPGYSNYVIPQFKDILDGKKNTVEGSQDNYKLQNLNVALINTLSEGVVTNLIVESPSIMRMESTPCGAIANIMDSGANINNCLLSNVFISTKGPVGAIAGNISGVTSKISDCVVSGLISGSSSMSASGFVVGNAGTLINYYENNDTGNLVFNKLTE